MLKKTFLILFCLFVVSDLFAIGPVRKSIRVGIILDADSFAAANTSDFFISDSKGRKFKLSKGMVTLTAAGDGLMLGENKLVFPVKIEGSAGIIFANKKPYRGYLTVVKSGKKVNIINVLTIEDYLRGVLPKEASPSWHAESLKAQAIISRTYTMANLNKHSGQGFDVCAQTHCQVYGGAGTEALGCNIAISETSGEVLTYNDKFAQTVFHANCGGHTEDPKYVWNWNFDTPEYLKGVKCGYCANAPHAYWENTLTNAYIASKLSSYNVEKIKSIKVKGETPAGSAKEVVITHSKGTLTLNAYKFRTAVDAWKIRSNTFDSIKKDGDGFMFKGRGWGHKVGLCQWGAKGMADAGKKYKTILQHYYPKTKIEKVQYN